jgi:hypothetical protein
MSSVSKLPSCSELEQKDATYSTVCRGKEGERVVTTVFGRGKEPQLQMGEVEIPKKHPSKLYPDFCPPPPSQRVEKGPDGNPRIVGTYDPFAPGATYDQTKPNQSEPCSPSNPSGVVSPIVK